MNDIQCKATAAGFIHALRESAELRDRWAAIRQSGDWGRLRVLIGETMGSAKEPTDEDLEHMRKHCDSRLGSEVAELQGLDARIEPRYVYNGAHPPGI